MVTATSFGPRRSALRQRAAMTSNAVESGPPEMARTRIEWLARSANSDWISVAFSAAAPSALNTLLLALDALLHRGGRLRILAVDFSECGAGHFLLLHRAQRLRETK